VIGDVEQLEGEDDEQLLERVAAIDVCEAPAQVCARAPHPSSAARRTGMIAGHTLTIDALSAIAEAVSITSVGTPGATGTGVTFTLPRRESRWPFGQ
jgi:hypothetical protein